MGKKRKAHFPVHRKPASAPPATAWVRQQLCAELLSDAHLGSGSGGGGIDALVARDRNDRPVIWASHVEGVMRDAARRLGRDADAFFGRAGGQQQRAIFTSLYAIGEPESHIWRATARKSYANRAPKDDTLRAIEFVASGTQFVGEVELPANQLDTLKRLVQEVDALGTGRSTGAGRVRLTLSDVATTPRNAGSPTERLVLLLKNRDPLCITATATPDNLIPSLAFVPGRTLLGALAAWLLAEGESEAASLLTQGRVSVSDALPLPVAPPKLEDVEVLPAPLTLRSEKPQGWAGALPWWVRPPMPTRRVDAWRQDDNAPKLKRPEGDLFVFRRQAEKPWRTFRPSLRVRLRNGRPDPNQADVSLFAIEQIVENTHFLAELHGTVEDMRKLTNKLAPVLDRGRWLRVGRGGAPVEVVQLAWMKAASKAKANDRALLILTSDLLARDEYLRWRTELDESALRDLLGVDVQLCRSLQDSTMVYGFNGTSRLWRMPAAAIRRGSVFEVSGPDIAKLAERAARNEWLGERTHEGFGRFRLDVDLPGVTNASGSAPKAKAKAKARAKEHGNEEKAARETQKWFEKHKALATLARDNERKPSLSQWFDLVADLEKSTTSALAERLSPKTAGGRSWEDKDAAEILNKLDKLETSQRKLYASMFVRWLRAELRARSRETR